MHDFKIGDKVYGHDWLFGEITQLFNDGANVEFDTPHGGGTIFVPYECMRKAEIVAIDI